MLNILCRGDTVRDEHGWMQSMIIFMPARKKLATQASCSGSTGNPIYAELQANRVELAR